MQKERASMVELNYRPLSALALHARSSKSPKAASVHVWELPKRRMLTLRIDTSNTALVEKAETAMGMSLPTKPNTLNAYDNDSYVLWTSPDEFMIDMPCAAGPDGADAAVMQALTNALAGEFALVTDVSDQMAGIGLGGELWREVWSKVCALDVHESVFKPGACGQTVAAKSNILFYGPDATAERVEHVRLYTRRSFSQYLFARLEDAALEYGVSLRAL